LWVLRTLPKGSKWSSNRRYGYAYALSGDGDLSGDLVQDCVLRAIGASRQPTNEVAYRAWLFRILRNAFIDRRRRAGKETQLDPEDDIADEGPWRCDARMIDVVTVRIAVARLSIAHREIIALVDFVGLSYTEAATVLGVAEGTVMSRLSRARAALLEIVADEKVTSLARARRARR